MATALFIVVVIAVSLLLANEAYGYFVVRQHTKIQRVTLYALLLMFFFSSISLSLDLLRSL